MPDPSILEIFEPETDRINLVGFTSEAEVLNSLQHALGREPLLENYAVKTGKFQRKIVKPAFSAGHLEARQRFFKQLDSDHKTQKTFFERSLPNGSDLRVYRSIEDFLELCDDVYGVVNTARKELKYFKNLPEAKAILERADKFDSNLEKLIEELQAIEDVQIFAIDCNAGTVASLPKMPEQTPLSSQKIHLGGYWEKEAFENIRLKMKKEAMSIAKGMGIELRKGILNYVREEFRPNLGSNNFRESFERLAMPTRLHAQYQKFLKAAKTHDRLLAQEIFEEDWRAYVDDPVLRIEFEKEVKEWFGERFRLTPEQTYPVFKSHYDIQNMFPPKALREHWIRDICVPINFKTKSHERKFLLAGLHSGGKSYFLENIVLASSIGDIGLPLLGDSITLPKYDHIYYYRNVDNENRGGKCETELERINQIIREAGRRDLVIIDEFLDSANPEIAAALGPIVLERLGKSPATVFVISHRTTNYDWLESKGWTIMSPKYEIKEDKVAPTWELERGRPNDEINKRYIFERYQSTFAE